MAVAKENDGETRENERKLSTDGSQRKRETTRKREMIYGTAQLYPNVKAAEC